MIIYVELCGSTGVHYMRPRPSKDAAEPKRGRAFSVFALMLGATAVAAVVRSTTVLSAVSTDAEKNFADAIATKIRNI